MIQRIIVEVTIELEKDAVSAACEIAIEPGQPVRVDKLTDACQRSVAHCVDELEKVLDKR